MEIKLQEPKKTQLRKEKVVFLPFFSGIKPEIKNKKIKKELDEIWRNTQSLEEGKARLVFSKAKKFIFLNLGEKRKWNQRKFLLNLRKTVRLLKENRIAQAIFLFDEIVPQEADLNNLTKQLTENILIADYEFNRYLQKPKRGWPEIKLIEVSWPKAGSFQKYLKQGEIVGKAVNFTRDLANIPGGEMTPQKMAEAARSIVKKVRGVKLEIFDEKKIKKLGMGGIMGVSQGSSEKPRLIILKYFGRRTDKKIDLVYVGKGVTFDTGGLNIKHSEAISQQMHMDMSGGAAVLGAISAIAQLKMPLSIVGLIPAVENMLSGQALRPGDILRAYNGKTIEVLNTDAEGRIILADALSYGAKNFKPKLIVDIATLTGAALVALGQRVIALFSNLGKIEERLQKIGENSGDYVWPLPCWEEYEEEIKGTVGDVINTGKTKYGEAITAARFLNNFTEDFPWIHLDIAPTMTSIENQGLVKGAAGSGVRYLIKLAQDFPKIKTNL